MIPIFSWFKFFIFLVSDYGNEFDSKENKNKTGSKALNQVEEIDKKDVIVQVIYCV